MTPSATDKAFKYPYLPFRTFLSLLDKMAKEGTPDRVDRTFLSYTSGVMQSYLIAALKGFGLIDQNNYKTEGLEKMVDNPDLRPQLVAELLKEHYSAQLKLGPNATAGMLEDTFKTLTGETKRKAITFFLHAAAFGDIKLSPHFKAPRPARGSSGRKNQRRRQETPEDEHHDDPAATEEASTVTLPSGTVLTLSLTQSVLKLPRSERNAVMKLVDQMEDLGVTGESDEDEEGGQI
jgi:hypothetical protein